MVDEAAERKQILEELRGLRSELKGFRAEWESETESNLRQYLFVLTIAIWALGVTLLLSDGNALQGMALMFLGFVPMYISVFHKPKKRG